MESYLKKNLTLFKIRFPQLYEVLAQEIKSFSSNIFSNIATSRDGYLIASDPIAGRLVALHSKFSVSRECNIDFDKDAIVFFGFGLGHGLLFTAKRFPDKAIVAIEPDVKHFLSALDLVDWEDVFHHKEFILLIASSTSDALAVINHYGADDCAVVNTPSHTAHEKEYFFNLTKELERLKEKERINRATLKRFAPLWKRNCALNKDRLKTQKNILPLKGGIRAPFLVLAAGPSLIKILPHLCKLKGRVITVAVDSALRSCKKFNFTPDFTLITDAQRAAYLHIAGVEGDVLIAPLEVYPAVFRSSFKKILLCKSATPFGEKEDLGDLDSGGSVACSAVNFSQFCGANKIFLSGLDLSYPKSGTHAKGCLTEIAAIERSNRLNPPFTFNARGVFSANTRIGEDYEGRPIKTDDKMTLFGYYLEKRIENFKDCALFTLNPSGLKIKGVAVTSIDELINLPPIRHDFFDFIKKT